MITYITYREAQFKGTAAADSAIALAEERGWSVSDRRYAGGHVIVTFRIDQDCSEGKAAERLDLPDFDRVRRSNERREVTGAGFRRWVTAIATGLRSRTAPYHHNVTHSARRVR